MVTVIDSSVLIAAERGLLDIERHMSPSVAIAAVTASELLHGAHRAVSPKQRETREAFVETLLSRVPVLPFDLPAARVHARVWAKLAARGISVGAHDLMIAATALANEASVASRDRRSFPLIPGLKFLHW